MKSHHYLVRIIKRGEPILFLEYRTLSGLLNCFIELEKNGITYTDTKMKDSILVEIDYCQTGTQNQENLGRFHISTRYLNTDWQEMVRLTLIKNRLN